MSSSLCLYATRHADGGDGTPVGRRQTRPFSFRCQQGGRGPMWAYRHACPMTWDLTEVKERERERERKRERERDCVVLPTYYT